ncbi:hypothetical protein PHYPSEUDO_002379 [Phytophthora pseudosyringae]|uniref:Helicase-associated domain-containing protein n=1 Tax=Phytophthora pseudosyringae TaxID=221518 RepID=A0A8T1VUQ1_9STRA|nr:hypothetical protein PHYPSEUDO_002379 [Phytophthora pseudosyringae]
MSALRTYKEKHGHLLVPYTFVVPHSDKSWPSVAWGYNLGNAVSMLRSSVNGCSDWTLSTEVTEELEAMGFITAASQFKWDAIIMPSLRRYYEVHGHTDVHLGFVVPRGDATWPRAAWGHRLGNTVRCIRHVRSYYPQVEELEEELERLELCYKTTISERDWKEKILPSLEAFREEFGHCLVTRTFKVPEDPKWPRKAWGLYLGKVVNAIRARATYTEQTTRDKDRLEAVGFAWNHSAGVWDDRIMPATETFAAVYPHCNVPQKFVVPSEEPVDTSSERPHSGQHLHRRDDEVRQGHEADAWAELAAKCKKIDLVAEAVTNPLARSGNDSGYDGGNTAPSATTKRSIYSKTYLALAPVADTSARQRLLLAAAPAIAAGTPINDDFLLSARMERQLRELEAQRGMVTRHEVLVAMVREHTILMEHAEAECPRAVVPMVMPSATLQ